tara:strand:+ start:762 stop:1325 length:564 start_codon:yes stop_codon:yes gene_type:complete
MTKYTYLVDRVKRAALTDARVNDFDETELAAAVLLVNAAKMDGKMSEAERQSVLGNLRRKFNLQDEGAEKLMNAAQDQNGKDASLYTAAQTLENNMSLRQRQELLGMVRDVVYSDGHLDPLEQALLSQMASMLNVPADNPAAARARVASVLGVVRERQKQHQKELDEAAEALKADKPKMQQAPTSAA